jgi:GntR family transcriptional regulator
MSSAPKPAGRSPPDRLVPEAAKPLYAQLRDVLRARILDGVLCAGSRIPSESELTGYHGVSRITVRQALNELQKEGLIFRVHGKGSFVSEPMLAQDVTRLRGLAEAVSAQGHEVHNRTLSLTETDIPAYEARKLALNEKTRVVRIETLRYLDRKPLSVDTIWVPLRIGRRLAKADLGTRDILDIYENDFGLRLGRADETIEATAASRDQSKRLKVNIGAPILHVERLIHLDDGQPMHLDFISYRGDAFRYRLSAERGRRTR